jgi:VCBS repeat-containing protein
MACFDTGTEWLCSDPATVFIDVTPVNDAPVADNDSYSTDEDVALSVLVPGVLDGDLDVDSATLTAVLVADVLDGELLLNSDGSFTYTPDADFFGVDSFTYKANDGQADSNVATVTITVNAVNDAPVALDDAASTDEDVAVVVDVLGNDDDVDGDTLTIGSFTQASSGSVSETAGGLTYTPNENFNGIDSFTYTACDRDELDPDRLCDTATVTITVNAVLDATLHYVGTTLTNDGVFVPLRVTAQPDDGEVVDWTGYTVRFLEGTTDLCVNDADRTTHEAVKPLFVGDTTDVGTAHCLYDGFSGNRNGITHIVTAQLVDADDNVIATIDVDVLVFSNVQQVTTGGGNLELFASGGQLAAVAGSKKNFGYKGDSGRGTRDPSGDINIVYDYEDAEGMKLYQIKAPNITSTGTVAPAAGHPWAEVTGIADLLDVTDTQNPVVLLSDLLVQVEATDNAPDSVAYSVWDADGYLIFATNWNGYEPVEQHLSGGNIDIK